MFFGWFSDRIGRKPIILGGCLLAALLYFPVFKALTYAANPALARAQATSPVRVLADPAKCTFQFDPIANAEFVTSCDLAKNILANAGVNYSNEAAPAGSLARILIGGKEIASFDGAGLARDALLQKRSALEAEVTSAIQAAGYPRVADPAQINKPLVLGLLWLLVLLVTMSYGPIAAQLVELFPTRIRYTSVSPPYHIGNGWFGGFLPPARLRHGRGQRQYLFRLVVSGRRGAHDFRGRPAADPRNQGPQYLRQRLTFVQARDARRPLRPERGAGSSFSYRTGAELGVHGPA